MVILMAKGERNACSFLVKGNPRTFVRYSGLGEEDHLLNISDSPVFPNNCLY